MAKLSVYNTDFSHMPELVTEDFDDVKRLMENIGVTIDHWDEKPSLPGYPSQEEILDYYSDDIERFRAGLDQDFADVVRIDPRCPDAELIRQEQLREHCHPEDETRAFIEGCGMFNIRYKDRVFSLVVETHEVVRIPAETPHWFDCGPGGAYTAIRLFNSHDAWLAAYTDDQTHSRFEHLEASLPEMAMAAE